MELIVLMIGFIIGAALETYGFKEPMGFCLLGLIMGVIISHIK